MVRLTNKEILDIETTSNHLWELYDDAEKAGDKDLAQDYADKVYVLLARLPQNQLTLSTNGTLERH